MVTTDVFCLPLFELVCVINWLICTRQMSFLFEMCTWVLGDVTSIEVRFDQKCFHQNSLNHL